MSSLDSIIINPQQPATACVIWLHGLGADGNDFANMLPILGLPDTHTIRFIFPNAPVRPITLSFGLPMPGWYDIFAIDRSAPQDEAGIRQTTLHIHALIQQQVLAGIASDRIILAGFSQGGAIALYAGLTYPDPLSSILALSTYLPIAPVFARERSTANQATPVLLAHGTEDSVVPFEFGETSLGHLQEMGYPVHWHTYPMAHTVCPEEIGQISAWIQQRLIHSV